MLANLVGTVDGHFIYDDQSTDTSIKVMSVFSDVIAVRRPDGVPSFLENEGLFRAAAWRAFEEAMSPEPGDWVLVIDCDQFLVARSKYLTPAVRNFLDECRYDAVNVHIHEAFGFGVDKVPYIRKDRSWGNVRGPRLFRYRPEALFQSGHFGVPGVPTYALQAKRLDTEDVALVHLGYAALSDRHIKYNRYSGKGGHSEAHVESIFAEDQVLERLDESLRPCVPWFAAVRDWSSVAYGWDTADG